MEYSDIYCKAEIIDGWDCRFMLRKEGTQPLIVIGLNPSTADEKTPDTTMRKIMGFIAYWNRNGFREFDSFIMLNLYPFRKTSPKELCEEHLFYPILHNKNVETILSVLEVYPNAEVLLCYGDSIEMIPWMKKCRDAVLKLLTEYPNVSLYSLGELTKRENPRHPCRLAYRTALTPFDNPFLKKVKSNT